MHIVFIQNSFRLRLLAVFCAAFLGVSAVSGQTSPPNVIVIFMDDMGYGDPVSYGGGPYQTPHLDRLAAEGMRFTHFYAAQPVCSASRAALLTGCYPNRIGIHGALFPGTPRALNPEEETIAELLQAEGYRTGMVGKWHLGDRVPFLPLQHGFDEYLGLPYSNDMWPVDFDGKPVTDTSSWKFSSPQLPLIEGNETVDLIRTLDDQATLTTRYTERACEFIRKNKEQPFFLYLAHSMPHAPIAVSDKFKGKSGAGLYGDVMMEIDWSVGEVMRTLGELDLDGNTLVVFTSDNGPWRNYGNHAGSSGGLREGKTTTWEGGQRVPCIMRWPGVIPAGTVCNQLASTIDLLPTLVDFCGAKMPVKEIDGLNIAGLMRGSTGSSPREDFAYYFGRNNLQAVRKGSWKLVLPHAYDSYEQNAPGYDGFPGKRAKVTTELALYDLQADPGERVDLKTRFPDVVEELLAVAQRYRELLGDELTGYEGVARRKAAMTTDHKDD